jgi:hypothetical protein
MSITTIVPADEVAQAKRWQQWQSASAESSSQTGTRVRNVFAVILTGLVIALGVQLLST